MKAKAEAEYTVEINGMPNYEKIPKATLEIGRASCRERV